MVSCHAENADISSHIVKLLEIASAAATVARSESPNVATDGHDCGTLIGFLQKSSTLSKAAIEIISASWRQGTEKRYNGHIKRFVDFCHKQQADPLYATTETGIEFLTEYFNTVVGYSAVNSARSVLSSVIKPLHVIRFGKDPLVSRFLKGDSQILDQLCRDMLQLGMLVKFYK